MTGYTAFIPQDEITALHIAGFKGHNSIVRYFCLAQKMMVDIQDKVKSWIAHLAVIPMHVLHLHRME